MMASPPTRLSLIAQTRTENYFLNQSLSDFVHSIDNHWNRTSAMLAKSRLRNIIAEDRAKCGDGKWTQNPTIEFVGIDDFGRFLFNTPKKMRYRWTRRL